MDDLNQVDIARFCSDVAKQTAGCWPPRGTKPNTHHWLAQTFPHGAIAVERALWDGRGWIRWIDSHPTGDFAELCRAVYVGIAPSPRESQEPVVIVPLRAKINPMPKDSAHGFT